MGFKIYSRAGSSDYFSPALREFDRVVHDSAYTHNGWRPISWACFEDYQPNVKKWRKIEHSAFKLGKDDILDVYEALWGPWEEDTQTTDETTKFNHRRKLVNTVRLLLGAVGIDYKIACTDEESDCPGWDWNLEGLSDRWFARETRKACGFQLCYDPEEEAKGRKEKLEEINGTSEDEDEEDFSY